MDGPLTDLEATVGTYQFRSYGGEQQNRQGDRALNRCAEGVTLTNLEANVGTYQLRSYGVEQYDRQRGQSY